MLRSNTRSNDCNKGRSSDCPLLRSVPDRAHNSTVAELLIGDCSRIIWNWLGSAR